MNNDSTPSIAAKRGPTTIVPTSGNTIYTCPMHPEVQQDQPGLNFSMFPARHRDIQSKEHFHASKELSVHSGCGSEGEGRRQGASRWEKDLQR